MYKLICKSMFAEGEQEKHEEKKKESFEDCHAEIIGSIGALLTMLREDVDYTIKRTGSTTKFTVNEHCYAIWSIICDDPKA